MNKQVIFISRELDDRSPFTRMRDKDLNIIGRSLLDFNVVPFLKVPNVDWYFFYSQNGVYFLFEQLSEIEKKQIASKKLAAIGPATAKKIKTYLKKEIDFIGTGETTIDQSEFANVVGESSVCFIRAVRSKRSMQLKAPMSKSVELIVYQNTINTDAKVQPCDIYVLTSSMNAEALIKNNSINLDQSKFVAIGQPTAQTLKALGAKNVYPSPEPTEEAMCKLAQQLL